jgi:outer membrane protein OmpA-like peptidoglycan-associated protein
MLSRAIFLFLLFSALRANAQASFDVQLFRPSVHSDSFITVESGAVSRKFDVRAQLYLNYANRPLGLFDRNGRQISSLDHRFDMNVAGSVALFKHLSLGLQIPATLFQGGNLPSATTPSFKPVAFGDLRFEPKVNMLWQERFGIDIALLLALTVPTASSGSFAGDRNVTFGGELDISRRFGPFRAALNYGLMWRAQSTYYNLIMGPEMYARAGIALDIGRIAARVPIEILAEVYGRTSLLTPFAGAAQSPMEGILALRVALIRQVQLSFGGGRGLLPGYGSPIARAFIGLTIVPFASRDEGASSEQIEEDRTKKESWGKKADLARDVDADNDGVADSVDKCLNETEDLDGFQDDDGCEDRDNDGDGLRDAYDRCPNEPETINGNNDLDGCPDDGRTLVSRNKNTIQIFEDVQFQHDLLVPAAFNMLSQVAAVILNHEIKKVRVEYYYTATGGSAQVLAQQRAVAVAQYLFQMGVAKERLAAVSFVGYKGTKSKVSFVIVE